MNDRLTARSHEGFALVDRPTMSGGDRRVSTPTTLATSPTRAPDIAGSEPRAINEAEEGSDE